MAKFLFKLPQVDSHKVRIKKPRLGKVYNGICLYMVTCKDKDHFYIGITSNPYIREKQHKDGGYRAAYFVRRHGFKEFKVLAWLNDRKTAEGIEQHYTHRMRRKYTNWVIAGGNLGHLQ